MALRGTWRIALAMPALVACVMATASSLQISPVTVDMPAGASAVGITLSNPGDQPLYGQVRVFRWTQDGQGESLEPTQDIVASPPLIEVAPHGEQLVRLVRRSPQALPTEQSYRALIDEIPRPEATPSHGVTIRLRYSVPIFVNPAGALGKPELSWQLLRDAQGWSLRVANAGTRHGQIGEVQLLAANQHWNLNKGLLGYVLAGQAQQWKVALDAPALPSGPLTVRAYVNGQPGEAPVAIAAPH